MRKIRQFQFRQIFARTLIVFARTLIFFFYHDLSRFFLWEWISRQKGWYNLTCAWNMNSFLCNSHKFVNVFEKLYIRNVQDRHRGVYGTRNEKRPGFSNHSWDITSQIAGRTHGTSNPVFEQTNPAVSPVKILKICFFYKICDVAESAFQELTETDIENPIVLLKEYEHYR